MNIYFSKKKCEEELPSKNIQFKPTNSETNNSDEKNSIETSVNVEMNKQLSKKSEKSCEKKSSKKIQNSTKKQSPKKLEEPLETQSSINNLNESPKHHDKISESKYDPTKKNYHPIKDAFWDHGQP